MAIRAAMLHPVGLALLCCSLALAVAVSVLPSLYAWSSRAGWLVLWGFVLYGGVVLAAKLLPPAVPPARDELRVLFRIRDQIASRLKRLRESLAPARRLQLESVLEDALRQIDDEITPAMRGLLEREADFAQYLALLDSGKLPLPDAPHLARLKTIHERQRATLGACVQQAANAGATLEAILQESNDAVVSERALAWAEDLVILHDALSDVIQENDPPPPVRSREADLREAVPLIVQPLQADEPGEAATGLDSLLVGLALRRLKNTALLAESDLIHRLPHSMLDALHIRLNGESADPSPSERAQGLQKILIDGIERLKPPDRDDGIAPESVQYRILREEYVEGHPTKWIENRYGISETTLHRYRRQAIEVLAGDLVKREQRLARDHEGVLPRR